MIRYYIVIEKECKVWCWQYRLWLSLEPFSTLVKMTDLSLSNCGGSCYKGRSAARRAMNAVKSKLLGKGDWQKASDITIREVDFGPP